MHKDGRRRVGTVEKRAALAAAAWEAGDVEAARRFLADGGVARCLLALLGRPELAEPCLRRLVYQMLLRCCSLALAVETELQKDAAVSYADRPLSYRDYLPLVDKLHAMQRPVRQIDLAVKVNDDPGIAGLAQLRVAGGYFEQARR